MFETFYPGNYVDSAYEIPYEKLYERGYRGIIFDVDNTLVPHGAPADARAIELFERLRAIGFSTIKSRGYLRSLTRWGVPIFLRAENRREKDMSGPWNG